MHEGLLPQVPLYRATIRGRSWGELLKGEGAYYTNGGRYNAIDQLTVYASDDPVVAISECCYYEARAAQSAIGNNFHPHPSTYPLVSENILWCFTLVYPVMLIDLLSPLARKAFSYGRSILTIPSHDYGATQHLASTIRGYPNPAKPIAGGLRAPSARAVNPHGAATQIVLFPRMGREIKAVKIERCNLTVQFLDDAGKPVTTETEYIDWSNPRIQIHGGNNAASLISGCLGGASIPRLSWQTIPIRFV